MSNGDKIEGPSGFAPAGAWEPGAEGVHRTADRWVACGLTHLDAERLATVAKEVECPADHGLRIRLVMRQLRDLPGLSMLEVLSTVLSGHTPKFLHAELVDGPEEGIFVSSDTRLPALLCQTWLPDPAAPGSTWLSDVPHSAPIHLNVLLHGDGSFHAGLHQLGPLFEQLKSRNSVHQLTVAHSDLQPHGVSVGWESRINEHGSEGGIPAVQHV